MLCYVDRSILVQFSKLNIHPPLRFSEEFTSSHFTPHFWLIFVEEGNLKFSDPKM